MPLRLTIKDLKTFAKSLGGKCLSTKYEGVDTKYLWETPDGRVLSLSWRVAKRGQWIRNNRQNYRIKDLKAFAQKKGGNCISTEYINNKTKYKWTCKCTHIWESTWMDVVSGHWCPSCKNTNTGDRKRKYSVEDVKNIISNKGGEFLSPTFRSVENRYRFRCSNKHEWETVLSYIIYSNTWCPECAKTAASSRAEKDIANTLEANGIHIIRNVRPDFMEGKELDIYIPDKKIAIEYCGLYWHHEGRIDKKYHNNKRLLCESQGIQLITIFEDEWIDREYQVTGFLKSKLGICDKKIFARKCETIELNKPQATKFFSDNHIQGGKVKVDKAFGLIYEGELVGAISGSYHHRNNKDYTLNRLAFKHGYNVVGGSSKLLKCLLNYCKSINIDKLVSWSDNRWSLGNIYSKVGFTLEEELPLDYTYVDSKSPRKRMSKQSCRKNNLLKKGGIGNTEPEMAESLGYYRVYDCGKKRWTLEFFLDTLSHV